MDKESKAFISGMIVGIFLGMCLFAIFISEVVDTASNIEEPPRMYEVTVDDLKFRCRSKPAFKFSALWLRWCDETYTGVAIIRNFESYSVAEINNKDQ